jgi:hypothetical protein
MSHSLMACSNKKSMTLLYLAAAIILIILAPLTAYYVSFDWWKSREEYTVAVRECQARIKPSWVECKSADGTLAMYSFTQSCLYHNIIFVRGKPVLVFEYGSGNNNGSTSSFTYETMKNRDDFTEHFNPRVIHIESIKTLCEAYCFEFYDDLSVLSDLWMGNIGHTLLDSFYAIFVGLIEYSSRHTTPFRIINTRSGPEISFIHDVISTLTPLGMVAADDFFSRSEALHLRELFLPNYARCMSCVNDGPGEVLFYGMGMGYELDAFRLLRAHTFSRYNLSSILKPIQAPSIQNSLLQSIAIDNKRFSNTDRYTLESAFNQVRPSINGKIVDWRTFSFKDQLRILSETQIYMSSSGTAIINQPFLPDGAVLINLGACIRFPYQDSWWAYIFYGSSFTDPVPGFSDQSIVAACSYHKALYYPVDLRCDGIMVKHLTRLLREAESIIRSDLFPMPQKRGSNLALDGLIVQELLRHDSEFRSQITDPVAHKACSTGIYFAPELIVSEHGPWSSTVNLCKLNHTLLKELKQRFVV